MGHSQRDCKVTSTIPATKGDTDDPITMIEINEQGNPPLMLNIDVECVGVKWTTDAIIDTGSPICIIKQSSVPSNVLVTPVSPKLSGINNSSLKVIGIIDSTIYVPSISFKLNTVFYVVDNGTMSYDCLLSRSFTCNKSIKLLINGSLMIEK